MLRNRFDPFCASSSIKIFAEVEEKGRGTKLNNTASVALLANQVRFSFDETMPRMFRPGMEYPVMVSGFVCIFGCACLINAQAHTCAALQSCFWPLSFCALLYIHVVTQIKSLLPGDLPARFKRFYLTVTANNGDLSIWTKNKTLRTDKRGEWMKSFLVPSGANCLKIVVCSAYVHVYVILTQAVSMWNACLACTKCTSG